MNELSVLLGQPLSQVTLTSERIRRYKVAARAGRDELNEILQSELRSDLEARHAQWRRDLGYKRKDVTFETDAPGSGALRTPDFDYRISASTSDDRSGEVTWACEVSLRDASLGESRVIRALGEELDTVIIRFGHPLDVNEIIDRIEAIESPDYTLEYDLGGEWCELTLKNVPAMLRVSKHELRVVRQPGTQLALEDMLALIRPR